MKCDFTFVHTADLHLGSRFQGISQKDSELGNRLFESTFQSFHRIVDIAMERADFMVISGDIYDEATMTPRTRIRFADEMRRLEKPVFLVRGNHDFKDTWGDSIPYPDNVHVLKDSPESFKLTFRGHDVEVTGMSYPQRHTSDNIAARLHGSPDMFTVAILHCSVSEVAESPEYAPCSLSDLLGKDIDYWALGHVHKRRTLSDSPMVVYPGNIQGRSPREIGEKGCCLVSVTGKNCDVTFMPTQSIIWKDVTVDITGLTEVGQLIDRVDVPPDCILSVEYTGRGPLDGPVRADPQGIADRIGETVGCVASVRGVRTSPDIDIDAERDGETLVSEIIRTSESYRDMADNEILTRLTDRFPPAQNIKQYLEWFARTGRLRELAEEAEMRAIYRVTGGCK